MSSHARGVLLLILVTCLWGSTFAVVKTLGQTLEPSVLIFWRFLIATLLLGPVLLLRRAWTAHTEHPGLAAPRPSSASWLASPLLRDGTLLGLWLIAGYGTQTVALQTTGANRAAFFTALSVVLVPLWLTLAARRKLPLTLWGALPLAVGGLALLSWEGGALVVGDLWALACAVTYAGFIITLERVAGKHAALPFTLMQLGTVTVLALLWAVIAAPSSLLPPLQAWGPLLYLGIAATALTTLLQTVGQRHVSAAEASLIYALEPVTATAFSYALIGEKVGLRGALGGLLVVVATVLSQRATATPPALDTRPESPHPEAGHSGPRPQEH